MALRWTKDGISVRQDQYVLKMLSEFELENAHPKKTLMQTGLILDKTADGKQRAVSTDCGIFVVYWCFLCGKSIGNYDELSRAESSATS